MINCKLYHKNRLGMKLFYCGQYQMKINTSKTQIHNTIFINRILTKISFTARKFSYILCIIYNTIKLNK